MEINFSPKELEAIQELAKVKELSPEALIRQALRLYHFHEHKIASGLKIQWIDKDGKIEEPLFFGGCGCID